MSHKGPIRIQILSELPEIMHGVSHYNYHVRVMDQGVGLVLFLPILFWHPLFISNCSLAPLTPFALAGAAHGGGKRCTHSGCSKSAVGGSNLCTSHGGGKRCAVKGCNKSAQSSTDHCVKHGGGKKCVCAGCTKVARGRTLYCAAHGGGVRCKLEGCNRVAIGKLRLCRAHGGGLNTGRRGKK